MGTDIEAAAVAAALGAFAGRAPGVRLPMPRSSSRGAAVGVLGSSGGPRRPRRQGGRALALMPPYTPWGSRREPT